MTDNVQGLQQMSHIKSSKVGLLTLCLPEEECYLIFSLHQTIIANIMEKFKSIPKRLEEDYHTLKDDTLLEDVGKIIEGEEDDDGTEFADTILLSDEDSSDRLESRSHKENSQKNNYDDDEKKDDKKDDHDDHDDHALIRT
uniref:Uncharacterized protein n=1 Tax=Tanacetum cinerariifolium TaxID=118510 RepID=A0A6L2L8S3_TANCI|nr:hypothetical protein [Tanacetum cinerariifolium]